MRMQADSRRLQKEIDDASEAVMGAGKKAGAALSKTLDLDGKAAKPSFPGGEGLLDTGSWRLTVGFLGLTIVLALFSGLTSPLSDIDEAAEDARFFAKPEVVEQTVSPGSVPPNLYRAAAGLGDLAD